jgi:hypothetical protein
MKIISIILLSCSVGLIFLRLFTGLVYANDEDTSFFVLKQRPSWTIERKETPDRPLPQEIILASDEIQVPFGDEYIFLMKSAPELVPLLVGGATILLVVNGRRKRRLVR